MERKGMRLAFLWVVMAGLLAAGIESNDSIARLSAAYPSFLVPSNTPNVVQWKDGAETVFDDGVVKTDFEDLLDRASLKDQMSMPYPAGWPVAPPAVNADPGRVRHEPFFEKMYGRSEKEVAANLVAVPWSAAGVGETLEVTRVNGVAEALKRVDADLAALPPDVRRYVAKPAGTFNWRTIAGTTRHSMHSYGAALDFRLPGEKYRYWRWEKEPGNPTYPPGILNDERLGQIVRIFEKHGFIWGGKWYHFDTMHFEYRPELLPAVESRTASPYDDTGSRRKGE
ncbi:MAG: M15 family metallopeptidase [FCB group bacterium]|jgi:hypothetical protein|nr:M15 family metallopeptidase [FCB group bacterium]